MKTITKLWVLIAILVVLAPLGSIVPSYFKAGGAWGEWTPDELKEIVGYIPAGLARLSLFWNAPVPDYAFKGWEGKPFLLQGASYLISGLIGVVAAVMVVFLIGKLLSKK